MKLIKASKEDAKEVFMFAKNLIDKYEDVENIKYDKVLDWVKNKILNNISEYNAIICDNEKVGFIHFVNGDDKDELDDFYIYPQFRNKGIGSQVLKNIIENQNKPIFLYVFAKNEGAIKLYKKFGFTITQKAGTTRYIMERGK